MRSEHWSGRRRLTIGRRRSITRDGPRDVRHCHHRRRHQRLRHRPRCGRARTCRCCWRRRPTSPAARRRPRTKLIHGGLRYLEHYAFRLVREALSEREVLLAMAPHIVRPLRFVLPHHRGLRPAWLIRLGLFSTTTWAAAAASCRRPARSISPGLPPASRCGPSFTRGFAYSDCWVDDARLVVLNAMDAAARGADIRVRTEVMSARRADGGWRIELRDAASGDRETVEARALVNATGAWVAETSARRIKARPVANVRLVKGSHIVVPRLFEHDSAYIFQNAGPPRRVRHPLRARLHADRHHRRRLRGGIGEVAIIATRRSTTCAAAVNRYFAAAIAPSDVVWSYAGVRSLHDDGRGLRPGRRRATSCWTLDGGRGEAPLLSIVGGKITTYRRVAEAALRRIVPHPAAVRAGPAWTRGAPLPGGDFRLRGPRPAGARAGGGGALPRCGHGGAAGPDLRHHGARRCSQAPRARRTSARTSVPASTSARCGILSTTNGPGQPTISCGGAPSWACASPRRAPSP